MNIVDQSRRDLLRNLSISAASAFLLANCRVDTIAQRQDQDIVERIKKNADQYQNWTGAKDAPANTGSRAVLAGSGDKGQPIEISGTVYRPDGRTPAPNSLIYLYHTDADGYYGRNGQPRHGRYRGWLLTDARGQYSFRSIKPAPYPENRWAAHIHMTVTTLSMREDSVDSILFEGDPLISAAERSTAGQKGGFNPILTLQPDKDGVLHGVRDIRLMA